MNVSAPTLKEVHKNKKNSKNKNGNNVEVGEIAVNDNVPVNGPEIKANL